MSNDRDVGSPADSWDELRCLPGIGDLPFPWPVERADRLGLHASRRRFYRLAPSTADALGPVGDEIRRGAVLVVYEIADAVEVQRYERAARWFADAGVRVPTVLASSGRGLLVEDGGDLLLSEQPGGDELASLYRDAARIILKTQAHGGRSEAPNPAWALDEDRLGNELEFTEEHALRGWLGAPPVPARAAWFDRLAAAVAELPRAMCHRDYHSRNLLVAEGSLFVVDFQDVMAGPIFYDLASLLRDDYRDVPSECRAVALGTFWQGMASRKGGSMGMQVSPLAEVPGEPRSLPPAGRQAWALTIAQRTLKALGTFGFQVSKAGRPEYAEYAHRTWRHARRALTELGWEDLARLLGAFDRL